MRDMMMAMVRLGSVQLLEQLGKTSQVLLDGIITRKTEDDEEETRHHESLKLNVSEKRRMSRTIVESVVEAYHLQTVDDIDLEMARPTFVRASFVHSFVRGANTYSTLLSSDIIPSHPPFTHPFLTRSTRRDALTSLSNLSFLLSLHSPLLTT